MDRKRLFPLALIALFAAAVVVRVLLLAEYISGDPLAHVPLVDAAVHHEAAKDIAGGRWIRSEPFAHPPLYAYFLAAVYTAAGPHPVAAAVVQALLGLAGLWMLYILARSWAGEAAALTAVFLAAFYGPLAFFELKLLPASLSVFLVLAFLCALSVWLRGGRPAWILIAGLACGLLVLDRPNMVFLPLLAVLWLLARRVPGSRRAALLLALGAAAGIAPAVVHNAAAGDAGAGVCSGGGLNFYLGNRRGADVSFTEAGLESEGREAFVDPAGMSADAAAVFAREKGRPHASAGELERFWIGKGMAEIAADPWAWLLLQLRKLEALLSSFEYGVNCSFAAERGLLKSLSLFAVPFWLLAALGAAGAILGPGACARPDDGGRGLHLAPLLLVLASVVLSALVFFTYSRFRLPAVPVLALLGGSALVCLGRRAASLLAGRTEVNGRRAGPARLAAAACAAVLIGGVSLLPPGALAKAQESGGHALVGSAFFRLREIDGALAAYERAAAVDPRSARTLQTWASVLTAAGRHGEARQRHMDALRAAPDDPGVLAQAALFLAGAPAPHGDLGRAEALARSARARDPGSALAAFSLGVTRTLQGFAEEGERGIEDALRLSGRSPFMLKRAADFYRSQGLAKRAQELEEESASGKSGVER